jgi:hypothetical protein
MGFLKYNCSVYSCICSHSVLTEKQSALAYNQKNFQTQQFTLTSAQFVALVSIFILRSQSD